MAHDIAVEKFPVVYGYATRHPGILILDDFFRLPVVLEEFLEEFVDLLVVIKSVKPAWFFFDPRVDSGVALDWQIPGLGCLSNRSLRIHDPCRLATTSALNNLIILVSSRKESPQMTH